MELPLKGKPEWKDNTTNAVMYPTEVRTSLLNVDSRFRDQAQSTSSTDFLIRLPRVYKNVITMRLSSIELPNTWYAFTGAHGETTFMYNNSQCLIPDGNYSPATLVAAVDAALTDIGVTTADVLFGPETGRITISDSSSPTLTFGSADYCGDCSGQSVTSSYTPYSAGLGYLMGFTNNVYTGAASYTGEYIVNTLRDNYVLLQLPDLEVGVDSFSYGNTSIPAFAKIIVDVDKNALIYDNGQNTVTKQIQFKQPTNVASFRVRLVDATGSLINLMADFSFTLEFQEVVSSKVYEAYRNNLYN
jgi:hypothetical protein